MLMASKAPQSTVNLLHTGWIRNYESMRQIVLKGAKVDRPYDSMAQFLNEIDRILKQNIPVTARIQEIRAHLETHYIREPIAHKDFLNDPILSQDTYTPMLNLFIIDKLRAQYSVGDWAAIESKMRSECPGTYDSKHWLENKERLYELMDSYTRRSSSSGTTMRMTHTDHPESIDEEECSSEEGQINRFGNRAHNNKRQSTSNTPYKRPSHPRPKTKKQISLHELRTSGKPASLPRSTIHRRRMPTPTTEKSGTTKKYRSQKKRSSQPSHERTRKRSGSAAERTRPGKFSAQRSRNTLTRPPTTRPGQQNIFERTGLHFLL